MSRILCIETATEACSVAVAVNGETVSLHELNEGYTHASRITQLIQSAVDEAGISLRELDAVAVSKGPGSYTGLRVGVSTAKGLCYTLNKPLIAINTLTAMTVLAKEKPEINKTDLLVPMLDARRMEVYCAVYDHILREVKPTAAEIINEQSFQELLDTRLMHFFGNGAEKCRAVLQHPNAVFTTHVLCSASGMAELAQRAFDAQQFEDVAYFEPFYLKDFLGTTPKPKL
jgi:tRNA threonylcarbamoyladenosine biosynthesis protein TsaB